MLAYRDSFYLCLFFYILVCFIASCKCDEPREVSADDVQFVPDLSRGIILKHYLIEINFILNY